MSRSGSLSVGERLFTVALALAGAFVILVVPGWDPELLREKLWAFEHLRDLPGYARWVFALVLVAAALPSVQALAWRSSRAMFRVARRPSRARVVAWPVAGAGCFSLFWLLRQRNFELGDSALLTQVLTRYVHLRGFHVTYDEPLDLYLHSLAYRMLHAAFGWPVEDAYALLSCAAGVGFVVVMIALWCRASDDPGRRSLGFLLAVSTASVQLFFGYVENYTLVALCVTVYVLLAHEYLAGRRTLTGPALVLGLGFALHVLAGWLFPSLLYLWWARPDQRGGRSLVLAGASLVAPMLATIGWLTAIGLPLSMLGKTHLAQMKFIFFTAPGTPQYQYAAFSTPHLINLVNELALVALPGIAAFAWIALFARREVDTADRFLRFLLVGLVFVQIFAFTWNPELGAYGDWDLFAITGFFWAFAGAWALVRSRLSERRLFNAGLPIAVLVLALTVSWVTSNARATITVDPLHDDAHLRAGRAHARSDRPGEAIRDFEQALRINPRNGDALLELAGALWERGEIARAVPDLEAYLALEPYGPHAARVRRLLNRARGMQ